jgi:transcriptional regulator with PAS, ATPase and Fis domain
LSVFTVHIPPLRDRRDDIPMLAEHFRQELNERMKRSVIGFSPAALELLSAHELPGNVRELQNEVERAFMLADDETVITPDLLSAKFNARASTSAADNGSLRAATDAVEIRVIREALERHQGNQTQTARALGLSRRGLIAKMQRHGLR